MEKIELIYSEELIKNTLKKYCFRQFGVTFFLVLFALIIYLICLVFTGSHSWQTGFIGSIVALGIIAIFFVYVIQKNRSLTKFKKMGNPKVSFEYSDTIIKISSGIGTSEFKWSIISKVMRFKNAWILCFSESETMIFPTSNVTEKSKNDILSKLKENNVKVE